MKMAKVVGMSVFLTLTAQLCLADCGKIIIVTCPSGMTPEQFIEKNQGKGNISPDLGKPKQDEKLPEDTKGDSGAGDGAVDIPPSDGDAAVSLGSRNSRAFFTEPAQRGVIAWNGTEEILVLMTDENSTVGKGAMLSFMPLPGKPIDIKKGDAKLYDKCYKMIKEKTGADYPGNSRNEAVLVRTIGAHNIFVWRIDDIDQFATKVQAYVQKRFGGKGVALLSKDTDRVVRDYYKRGFRYFAFDLINAPEKTDPEKVVVEKVAIEYHFESKFVYYPMVVSQSGGTGKTRVELAVFTTPEGVNTNAGKLTFADTENRNGDILTLGKKSVTVTNKELTGLHAGMGKLFGGKDARARVWVIKGEIDEFNGDVQAYFKK